MLLIPQGVTLDWRKPPTLTMLTLVICLLVFLGFQSLSASAHRKANDYYVANLLPLEWPFYEAHLTRHNLVATELATLQTAWQQHDYDLLADTMGPDLLFADDLEANGERFMEDGYDSWQEKREAYRDLRQYQAEFALGLHPQFFRPLTFITFNYLHQGWLHLLLNLLLLAVLGLAVETALAGRAFWVFLAGGVSSGLIYISTHAGMSLPGMGLNGALAAWTGALLAHYHRQDMSLPGISKPVPAFAIIPVWLAIEALQVFALQLTAISLLGDLAAMALGAALAFALQTFLPPKAEEEIQVIIEEESVDMDQLFREQLSSIMELLARYEFPSAQKRLRELLEQRPDNITVLLSLYRLEKVDLSSDRLHDIALRIFLNTHADNYVLDSQLRVLQDYMKHEHDMRALTPEVCFKLVLKFIARQWLGECDKLMQYALENGGHNHPLRAKTAGTLANAWYTVHDSARASRWKALAT